MNGPRTYTLLGADGRPYQSASKGQWGGHRGTKIYGRLDCPAALRAIACGGYTRYRVFFADQASATAAGYRPCATCCPDRYQEWKSTRQQQPPAQRSAKPARGRQRESTQPALAIGSKARLRAGPAGRQPDPPAQPM